MPCSPAKDLKKSVVNRLPTGRPCMSGKASTTVSTDPSAMAASMSSRPCPCPGPGMRHVDPQPGERPVQPAARRRYAGAMLPLIGVSTYVADVAWASWERRAAVLPASYFELVAAAGGRPLLLPPTSSAPGGPEAGAAEVIAVLDGLVLTGGGDVDPAAYGEEPDPEVGGVDPDRDASERALLAAALDADMPGLAGAQRLPGRLAPSAPARRGREPRPPQGRHGLRGRRRGHRARDPDGR